jgi:hypothetical protein
MKRGVFMETDVRRINPSDFLTENEMRDALILYANAQVEGRHDFAQRFANAVIRPNLLRICQALGQPCDPLCLAYAMESALDEAIAEIKGEKVR